MEACCLREVSDGPVQGGSGHPHLCTCHSHDIVQLSHVLWSQLGLTANLCEVVMSNRLRKGNASNRRSFIGGSDARIIMGDDEATLLRLWREKRGEVEPQDLSRNLLVQ